VKFAVGGIISPIERDSAWRPPRALPRLQGACPCSDFVELINNFSACVPNTDRIASTFRAIVRGGSRAMGVDVADCVRCGSGVLERGIHRSRCAHRRWLRDVMRNRTTCRIPRASAPDSRAARSSSRGRVVPIPAWPRLRRESRPRRVERKTAGRCRAKTTRIASQAFNNPSENGASLTTAGRSRHRRRPLRTIQNALADRVIRRRARGSKIVYVGPVILYSSEIRLAPGIGHRFSEIDRGLKRMFFQRVEAHESLRLR